MHTYPLFYRVLLAVFLLLASIQSGFAESANGKQLYIQHCSVCHGDKGAGGVGVPLNLESFQSSISDHYLAQTIKLGRFGRTMPSFKRLGDKKINAIIKYVRTFSSAKPARFSSRHIKGDIQQGEKIFKSRCASCHGDHGQGGKGTGVTFSRPRDLSIIPPALNNASFLASASDEMIKHTLIRGRDGTPMNSFLKQGLSEKDINNVVAYIRNFEKTAPKTHPKEHLVPVIVEESPYSLEKTLDNLKKAVVGKNFRIIREQTLDNGLVDKNKQNHKQVILYFCNFQFLNESLALDPRIGLFLPCRVTVIQDGDKVKVMAINPLRLSKVFNNNELDNACKSMTDLYTEIIEEATL